MERGLPGIYAILEKESATGIIGAIAVAVAPFGVGALMRSVNMDFMIGLCICGILFLFNVIQNSLIQNLRNIVAI